jgi:hypothetical protein
VVKPRLSIWKKLWRHLLRRLLQQSRRRGAKASMASFISAKFLQFTYYSLIIHVFTEFPDSGQFHLPGILSL